MITNMIVLLCLSALFPVLMGTDEVKSDCFLARDCSDIYSSGKNASGVYSITSLDGPVQVYCEMVPSGINDRGHWTVILRRMDGEVNFFRPWESYKKGFGNKEGEYWLGLEFMHQLTSRYQYKLRIDLEDFEGKKAYSLYESFSVDSESDEYKLHVTGFVDGGAAQTFGYHNGMPFSTFDKDNSGLEFMHQLTSRYQYKLRIDLEDFEGKKAYSLYESFSVDSESDEYKLHVTGFVDGGAAQTFGYHNGMPFSTFDKDNSGHNCAKTYAQGGFWYNNCDYTNPTGLYWWGKDDGSLMSGPFWYYWKSSYKSLKTVTMKIRRVM
ncbi:microfibril-associated glycoprotein 4-like [Sinocyclocheilus rhinocerous]|uniref:microfibril-associated glycoprotein 4-like n=1 Tax=Sinocyclocheilus rhinocerous TaxID=307959 RepID=UPI0007BA725B|nr:PREDICTED: microfibril-associated glycoprotein 4-like [Sinocyclocheilus rhinocerous]